MKHVSLFLETQPLLQMAKIMAGPIKNIDLNLPLRSGG